MSHQADTEPEFFGDTACATLVATGGTLYGPSLIPAGASAAPRTAYTVVSQSAVTGAGSSADPYRIVTVVDLGTSGLRISQTDSYIVGQESYRTDVEISNSTTSSQSAVLYRAGDCFLQNSDEGFGSVEAATGAVACVEGEDDGMGGFVPGDRIEQWFPLSAGSAYYESFYDTVWAAIGSQLPFPSTCECATYQDNGAGLSWSITVPAGSSVTRSHLTTFSPLGTSPLTVTKTADSATSAAGGSNGYTITVSNSNPSAVSLASITDTLPAGFSYTPGSSTGATTTDPGIVGQTLTWTGPFSVPGDGSLTLHFGVTVSSTPGEYFNEATADAGTVAVAGSGPTAKITVTEGQPPASTSTTYTGAASVQYSDSVALSATLLDTSVTPNVGVSGKTLTFAIGTQSASAGPTDSAGNAATSLVVTQAPGSVATVGTSFAGDATYAASSDSDPFAVLKEDCTLTYTGSTLVAPGGTTTLSAVLGELDLTLGDRSNKTIDFAVQDAAMNVVHFTAQTDASGSASTTANLPAGAYSVTATFAGDAFYLPCSAIEVLLTVEASPDIGAKVTGGGFIVANGRTSFGFNAISDASGLHGQLQLRGPGNTKFHGSTVTSLTITGNSATWSGTGRWQGVSGYTFEASVTDNRAGGSRRGSADTFAITIRAPGGAVVFTTSGSLKGGNLTVH